MTVTAKEVGQNPRRHRISVFLSVLSSGTDESAKASVRRFRALLARPWPRTRYMASQSAFSALLARFNSSSSGKDLRVSTREGGSELGILLVPLFLLTQNERMVSLPRRWAE